jgi:gas vesicle protein
LKHFHEDTVFLLLWPRIRKENNMSENSSGGADKFLFFVAGAGIGAVLALLFAPKSGRETRELIARTATDSRDFINSKVNEGRQLVEEKSRRLGDDFTSFMDKSKEAVQRQKEQLTAAFEAGKAAYRDEKGIPHE